MTLAIETFDNAVGGNAFYKAITHPLAAVRARELIASLRSAGPIAIYDPQNFLAAFDALYPLDGVALVALYVQDVEQVDREFRGLRAAPVSELLDRSAMTVLVASFDPDAIDRVRTLAPNLKVLGLDTLRLPDEIDRKS